LPGQCRDSQKCPPFYAASKTKIGCNPRQPCFSLYEFVASMLFCLGSKQSAARLALLEKKRHCDTCPDLWKPCAKGFFFCAAPGPLLCLTALPLFTGAVILAGGRSRSRRCGLWPMRWPCPAPVPLFLLHLAQCCGFGLPWLCRHLGGNNHA